MDERRGLAAAFRRTHFEVLGVRKPFTLRIERPSRRLAMLHRQGRVRCSAFLTACNPGASKVRTPDWNRRQQRTLEQELTTMGICVIRGFGRDPTSEWPGEDSCLALGLLRRDAKRLGKKYRQLAIVWAGENAVPRLVWS